LNAIAGGDHGALRGAMKDQYWLADAGSERWAFPHSPRRRRRVPAAFAGHVWLIRTKARRSWRADAERLGGPAKTNCKDGGNRGARCTWPLLISPANSDKHVALSMGLKLRHRKVPHFWGCRLESR